MLGCVGALLTLLGFLGHIHQAFELIASFKVHYVAGLLLVLLVALIIRFHLATILLLGVIGVHGFEIARQYIPYSDEPNSAGSSVRVMTSNLLKNNSNHSAQIEHVNRVKPDVVVFQEYTHAWHDVLSKQLTDYPHVLSKPMRGPFGIAIYSKHKLINPKEIDFNEVWKASLTAELNVGGSVFRFIGTHPVPPISSTLYNTRNAQLMQLGELVEKDKSSLVLAGDLNTVTWSVWFKDLLEQGNLMDTRRGFGVLPTWPSWFAGVGIPIDHILVSDDIDVIDANVARVAGSDHSSYWVDLMIRP